MKLKLITLILIPLILFSCEQKEKKIQHGPHHGTLLKGIVRPYVFQNAPEIQPEGNSYSMID